MLTSTPSPSGAHGDLLLKVTPPRAPRHLLPRPRLRADDERMQAGAALLVQAPGGFGKTSLLAQLRREHLARGRVVAWLSAQAQDEPGRFVRALALAVRTGAGRPGFGRTLLEADPPEGLEGVTRWLAELAQSALDLVLFVDEADRLPAATRDALAYLLRNAPPNLRTVVAARADCRLGVDDLIDYGLAQPLGADALRFTLPETIELMRARLGDGLDRDAAARLHELTEGWPLGLQLALSAMAAGGDPQAELVAMASRGGALRQPFVELLLANLDPADVDFLTRVALLDHLHAELCAEVTGDAQAAPRLERLLRDTPLIAAHEAGGWLRLHTLAHDELRRRFDALTAEDRARLHGRAAAALGRMGLVGPAARHALAAGRRELAWDLAERGIYDALMARGLRSAALEWLAELPAEAFDDRPRLRLAMAWSQASSDRHAEARRHVDRLLAQPGVTPALARECALIQSAAAIFADDPDRFVALHDPWMDDPPPEHERLLRQVHVNRSAYRALLAGEPSLARARLARGEAEALAAGDHAYLSNWSRFIFGLSCVWEGQVRLAEQRLRPMLARAEAELGRRSPFPTMLAAVLAAACWERNAPDDAAALLANRLDVLERHALPEAVLLGFRTIARIAAAEGAEHRALALLGGLDAVGAQRDLPRLRIASLVEQVRLHARSFRAQTCQALCERIDALLDGLGADVDRRPLWHRGLALLRELALAHAAIAAQSWRAAADRLARADGLAQALSLGRQHIELLGLRAWALDRCGERTLPQLQEAADLARLYGLARVFDDAHPALGRWAREALPAGAAGMAAAGASVDAVRPTAPTDTGPPPAGAASARPPPSTTALTPKEREVLELVARNLSNKEIGLALQVGEQTIKWHLKNLFAKLDAGTRKQLVQRARILGMLAST